MFKFRQYNLITHSLSLYHMVVSNWCKTRVMFPGNPCNVDSHFACVLKDF